jgi:Tfp pilus assembly protein PilO
VTARFASMSTRAQVALISGALLLVLLIGYFALISPKRSTAAELKQKTAAVQQQIDQNRSAGFKQALPAVRSASVFSVAKAMPNQLETPNVILQLNQLALDSGISFDSISPGGGIGATAIPTPTSASDPFAAQPITVQFTGSYYNLLAFLLRLRNLVRIENGHLDATGRLFDVSNIEFGQPDSPKVFPVVKATLTINAFVPQQAEPALPGSTDTSSTATTTTGTTTTTSNSTSASPATSGGTS